MATDDKRYPKNNPLNDSSPAVASPPPPGGLPSTSPGPPVPGALPSSVLDPLSTVSPSPVDAGPKGAVRFNEMVRKSGFTPGSEEYDQFIIKAPYDPLDTEYTALVRDAQSKAFERKRVREEEAKKKIDALSAGVNGQNNAERLQDVNAKKKAVQKVEYVDSLGNIIVPDKTVSTTTSQKPGQTADQTADTEAVDVEEMTDSDYIATGNAVWVGQVGKGTDQYRSAADMMNDVYRWNAGQTAAFQKRIGLDATGVADDKTIAYWKWVVNTSRYYTAMGQKRTVDSIVQQGSSGSGGGGGGGGGGTAVPADAAKRILNQAMKEFAGREATEDELKQFLPAIRASAGSTDFDAAQFATDWVRGGSGGARSGEVANYQAATDYYSVVQQLIGGR